MEYFTIKDKAETRNRTLGYLIYNEKTKLIHIELLKTINPDSFPFFFYMFTKEGQYTLSSYWSERWVMERVVPAGRHNINQILRENKIDEFDLYKMLVLTKGKSPQDTCYIQRTKYENLPDEIKRRIENTISEILPVDGYYILVFFKNGESKLVDIKEINDAAVSVFIQNPERFSRVSVEAGGFGIKWNERAIIPYTELYEKGIGLPMSLNNIRDYITERTVNTAQAAEELGCSKQNIEDLTKRGKIHPIRNDKKATLFLKNEIYQRQYKTKEHVKNEKEMSLS